jgi:hypothetical protein
MATVHSFNLGDRVRIYQMNPNRGLMFEGMASIVELADADEYYEVRFDNEPDETYQRFVDRDGQSQDDPTTYIAEFNKRIGYK